MTTESNAVTAPQSEVSTVSSNPGIKALPKLLRGFGAAVLVASVSIFLFQGWESGNDVYRYLLLLAHTAGLAFLGVVSSHWIRESKGARLLLILALASVPANFAILGGFVYSQWALDGINVVYPHFVTWRAGDPATALITAGIALLVLAPVIWFGFMVLSRGSAGRFTALYLLTNAALLVPLRATDLTGWLALALTLLVLMQNTHAKRVDAGLKTPEGVIARGLQLLPLGVMLGRGLWLYAADAFVFTVMSVMVFLVLRHVTLQLDGRLRTRAFLERLSILPATATGFGVAYLASNAFPGVSEVYLPVFTFTVAALVLEISLRTGTGGAGYRRLATGVLTSGLLANLVIFGGVIMAALCLMLGLLVIVYGYMVEQRVVFVLGGLTLLVGLGYQVQYAIQIFDLGSWASLAALGVSAILIGSAIERHGSRIKIRLAHWGERFRSWQY
ncbi:MAG TPA: hypothetical protein DCO71_05330 [Gammaproteobacteria bacterium]|nr:hypothetical protein [Gammaproteobacteria bacterium]